MIGGGEAAAMVGDGSAMTDAVVEGGGAMRDGR